MDGETEQTVGTQGWLRPALLGWLAAMVLLWALFGSAVAPMRFSDPDDQLRLIQVRDLLAGQGWWDLNQYRIDPPRGVLMHWSRLVDIPIAATIALLAPIFGQHGAELAALVLVPALTLLCVILLVARIANRLVGRSALAFAMFPLLLSLPLMLQLRPTRLDHHGWQVAACLAAINGLLAHDPRKGGLVVGLGLAVWLSISMEALPIAAALFAIMALRWLREPEAGLRFVTAIQSLAIGSLGLALISRNPADLVNHCDSVSPVHLTILVWCALSATLLGRCARRPAHLLAGLVAIGAGGLGILLVWTPQCTGGGFNELGPVLERVWYRKVIEGQPVWRNDWPVTLQFVVPMLVGLAIAVAYLRRIEGPLRERWLDFTLALGVCVLGGLMVSRTSAYAGALAAIPLGLALSLLTRRVAAIGHAWPRRIALLTLGLTAAVILAPILPATIAAERASGAGARAQTGILASCRMEAAMPVIRTLPRGTIFAQLDIGPELLLLSDHRVVATAHHRAPGAMLDVFEGLAARPDAARTIIAAHQADYVMLCPEFPEINGMVAEAPDGLAAQLRAGRTPAWLEPIALPSGTKLRAWRVRR